MLEFESRTFAQKLRLGAFYTSPELTDIICRWAIRSKKDRILEPGFGGCSFLASCRDRLGDIGAGRPKQQLYGCDIDTVAFQYLDLVIGKKNCRGHFLMADFLKSQPGQFGGDLFNVIIGNPPYLSRHRMLRKTRKQVNNFITPSGSTVNRASALWVYFIYHAFHFLSEGGRMAWVLPASYLYADYAGDLRTYLSNNFAENITLMLPQKIFAHEDVKEPTVAILLDGYHRPRKKKPLILSISDLETIEGILDNDNGARSSKTYSRNIVFSSHKLNNQEKLETRKDVVKLGDLFNVSIGLVTGDNRYFVISESAAQLAKLPNKVLKPILASSRQLSGLAITDRETEKLRENNGRMLLFSPKVYAKNTLILRYLKRYPKRKRSSNVTFLKREPWYVPPRRFQPEAFLTGMGKSGPRLVINRAKLDCTNTLYRLQAKDHLPLSKLRVIAISFHSSLTALAAEKLGRRFKSGAIKIEPSAAKNLLLLVPTNIPKDLVNAHYVRVDSFLRKGDHEKAREASDAALIAFTKDKSLEPLLQKAAEELSQIRSDRIPE